MLATRRIYRANDGSLVGENHPDAAFLRYAVGDGVLIEDEAEVVAMETPVLKAKMVAPPANKRRRPGADK